MNLRFLKSFIISLPLAILITVLSVNYQKEVIVTACVQIRYCPDQYTTVNSAGFPLQFVGRADDNSLANRADFKDGWNRKIFLGDVLIYFLILFPSTALLIKEKSNIVSK